VIIANFDAIDRDKSNAGAVNSCAGVFHSRARRQIGHRETLLRPARLPGARRRFFSSHNHNAHAERNVIARRGRIDSARVRALESAVLRTAAKFGGAR
jgi:hypothetical protein